jgi:hypothetical protein
VPYFSVYLPTALADAFERRAAALKVSPGALAKLVLTAVAQTEGALVVLSPALRKAIASEPAGGARRMRPRGMSSSGGRAERWTAKRSGAAPGQIRAAPTTA